MKRAALLIALGLATCPLARADEESDRVRQLEEDMRLLREEFEAYRKANPAGTTSPDRLEKEVESYLSSTGAGLADEPASRGLRVGGYATLGFINNDMEPSVFDLGRMVLSMSGPISEGIDFLTEIEFEGGGISDEFVGEIKIEQAVVTFRPAEWFQPAFGWVLVPFGRYNLYHDDPMNDFTIRPFTARFLVPTGFGQPGIGASGSGEVGGGEHILSYDVVLTNGFMDGFNAAEGTGEARQNEDNNDGKQVWGRVAFQPHVGWLDHLEIGGSGTYGIYDDDDHDAITGWALDFLVRKGPLEFKGEYIDYNIGRSVEDPPGAVQGQSGVWVEGSWRFFPPSWRKPRRALVTETSCFVLAARWQWMDLDDRVTGATFEDDLQAFSLGLNYRLSEKTVFRIDYTWFFPELGSDQGEFTFSMSTYF